MGYELRRWLADSLPPGLTSGERLVALEIADQANDETRLAYGRELLRIVTHRTGYSDPKQIGKVLGKLAGRGIELRVPIRRDGVDVVDRRGRPVYAHEGHETTYRIPTELELPPAGDLLSVDNAASGPPSGGALRLSAPPVGSKRSPAGGREVPPQGDPSPHSPHRSPQEKQAAPSGRDRPAGRPASETFHEYAERHRQLMVEQGEELTEVDEEFIATVIADNYVVSQAGGLDEREQRIAYGMRESGAHPKAVVNTILKRRGESEADYRDAQSYLLELGDQGMTYLEAARTHVAIHFPEAGDRYAVIYAARLAQKAVRS